MDTLPDHVILLILNNLKIEDIERSRGINRLFRDIIDDDKIIERRFDKNLNVLAINNIKLFDQNKRKLINDNYRLTFRQSSGKLVFMIETNKYVDALAINKYDNKCKIFISKNRYINIYLFIIIDIRFYIFGCDDSNNIINKKLILRDVKKIFYDDYIQLYIIHKNKYVQNIFLNDKETENIDKDIVIINGKYKYFDDKFLIYINETGDLGKCIYINKSVIDFMFYSSSKGWYLVGVGKDEMGCTNNRLIRDEVDKFIKALNLMTKTNNYNQKVIEKFYNIIDTILK